MISVIAAMSENRVLGSDNSIPWHIREDFRRFREITMGHPVIMGRRTYDSIGRPLPGRVNVVVTRDRSLSIDGCVMADSLEGAVAMYPDREVFVIGGGSIYAQAMPMASRLYLTLVHIRCQGDTFFPEIGAEWHEVSREYHPRGEDFDHPFEFVDYCKQTDIQLND